MCVSDRMDLVTVRASIGIPPAVLASCSNSEEPYDRRHGKLKTHNTAPQVTETPNAPKNQILTWDLVISECIGITVLRVATTGREAADERKMTPGFTRSIEESDCRRSIDFVCYRDALWPVAGLADQRVSDRNASDGNR